MKRLSEIDKKEKAGEPLRSALVHSSSRAAVHLLQRVGLSEMPAVPSLALGTGEVSLLDLTSAHTAFANGGVLQPPVLIRRIEDAEGRVVFHADEEGRRVFSESTAFLMASMLSDVNPSRHRLHGAAERVPPAGRRQDSRRAGVA